MRGRDLHLMALTYFFRPDEDDDDSSAPSTKRPRASINNKQLEDLKNMYNVNRKPSRSLREELGKKLGLDVRVVQVWLRLRFLTCGMWNAKCDM